jgi:hypothetical protein
MSSARKTKLKLAASRPPRNPLVALARTRKAGTHRKSEKARRSAEKAAIKKEIGR